MKQSDVITLVDETLFPAFKHERDRMDRIDRWYRWDPEQPTLRSDARKEERFLLELARTPWLGLVVTTVAQMLYAESLHSIERDAVPMWEPWQRNDMRSRQIPLHRAALAYGLAYATALPGDSGAAIRGVSPRNMIAVYQDVAEDEWPMYALRVIPQKSGNLFRVIDEGVIHYLTTEHGKTEYIEERAHDVGVCPVIRYANQIDLEGRTPGEVEPFIPVAARINKTSFDRLLAQHFNSWKVRTATGLEEPGSQTEGDRQKILLRQSDILTGGPDVTFGSLPETSLDGFIKAWDSDIESLAAVSQTPAHSFGKLINLSAEALAAAESQLQRKVLERQASFGVSHAQVLRLAAHIEGRGDDAGDFAAQIQWADMESRALASAVDALGKASQMLGVPQEMLWDRIPGVTAETAEEWRVYAEAHPSEAAQMASALSRQTVSML